MKISVIDIGSNSVRLMMWADGKTLYKTKETTRLGDGLSFSPVMKADAIERTAQAVARFNARALSEGAERVYAFATAAVRASANPKDFTDRVKQLCGIEVDVISGEREAEIGLAGALGGGDGGIIDVGGASTEVTLRVNGRVEYSKSVNIGTVRILNAAGRNIDKINEFVSEKVAEYGVKDFSKYSFYAVGGTASRVACIKNGARQYSYDAIHGTEITANEMQELTNYLTSASVEEIRDNTICSSSADLVGGGTALLLAVMRNFGIEKITVSDTDNLEGYLLSKLGK